MIVSGTTLVAKAEPVQCCQMLLEMRPGWSLYDLRDGGSEVTVTLIVVLKCFPLEVASLVDI